MTWGYRGMKGFVVGLVLLTVVVAVGYLILRGDGLTLHTAAEAYKAVVAAWGLGYLCGMVDRD